LYLHEHVLNEHSQNFNETCDTSLCAIGKTTSQSPGGRIKV